MVIDVLRAGTTITRALDNGCSMVIPTSSVEEAMEIASGYQREDILLGGERNGVRINGFHLGNSPSEYTRERVQDKKIIFTTTNGTRTMRLLRGASAILIGCLANAAAVAEAARGLGQDVVVVCSGREGMFSLEDAVCAGLLVRLLGGGVEPNQEAGEAGSTGGTDGAVGAVGAGGFSDGAVAARQLYEAYGARVAEVLRSCRHGRFLQQIGLGEDVDECSAVDSMRAVGRIVDGNVIRRIS